MIKMLLNCCMFLGLSVVHYVPSRSLRSDEWRYVKLLLLGRTLFRFAWMFLLHRADCSQYSWYQNTWPNYILSALFKYIYFRNAFEQHYSDIYRRLWFHLLLTLSAIETSTILLNYLLTFLLIYQFICSPQLCLSEESEHLSRRLAAMI